MKLKRRFKTLLSAIIAIILSISVVTGSTFALFTSNDSVNIAITGGKVQVTAIVNKTSLKVYSKDVEQNLTDTNGATLFENGGTVSFDDNDNLVLDRVTPGDKVTFNIDVVNNSNVDVIYRVNWAVSGELESALIAKADDQIIVNNTTDWTEWNITTGYEKTIAMSVELPMSVNNDYQEKSASIYFSIEFVQANAEFADTWDGTVDPSFYLDNPDADEYEIGTAEQLAALAALVDGGKIDSPITTYNNDGVEKLDAVTFDGVKFTLTQNIDLYQEDENGERVSFDPIGFGYDVVFKGEFDGQGHTISNLYQDGGALGLSKGTQGGGLFASVVDATIKNLTIDNAEIVMNCVDMGILAGYSYGTCTYENITITNSTIANYQRYTGGVVGEVNGTQTFKNVDVKDTVVSGLWGDFDASLGGIVGGKWGEANLTFEDCDVACEINAVNDVVSTYNWYAYRRAGMLIGNSEEVFTDENGRTSATASYLTAINCTVTYGDWMNYTYCKFSENATGTQASYPWVRVQSGNECGQCGAYYNVRYGVANDANGNKVVDDNHVHGEGEEHNMVIVFDQLFGGGQGVYGTATHPGVRVNYPASYNPENN